MNELTPEREQDIRTRRGHIVDAPWGSRGDGEGGNTVQAGAYITPTEGFASSGDVAHIVARTPEQSYRRASFIARAPHDIDDLLTEIDRLRAQLADKQDRLDHLHRNSLPDLRREIDFQRDSKKRWRNRAETAEQRLHDAAMTRTWTNEDGKKFVFVEDIAPALLGRKTAEAGEQL